jgi:hypothetical protein
MASSATALRCSINAPGDLLERSVRAAKASTAAGAAVDGVQPEAGLHDDVMDWLGTALTYHDTCRDGLHEGVDADDGGKE